MCTVYQVLLTGYFHVYGIASLNNRVLYKSNQFLMLTSLFPILSLCNTQQEQ